MNIGKVKTAGDQGAFFYALNKNETNKWDFNINYGRDDNHNRISCEEEALIASEIYARLTSHDALTERVKVLEAALTKIYEWDSHSSEFAADYGSNGVRDFYRAEANKTLKAGE